jgi:hypothetical protein
MQPSPVLLPGEVCRFCLFSPLFFFLQAFPGGLGVHNNLFGLELRHSDGVAVFRFSWKWRKRSAAKITERTHEDATEALHAGREGRHPEAAFAGQGADLGAV